MDFPPPFGFQTEAYFSVRDKQLTLVVYRDGNGFQKKFYCWGWNAQLETYKTGHKDHVMQLDLEWNEEVGFVDKGVEVLVEQVKQRPVDFLGINAWDAVGQELLVKELEKWERMSVGLLLYIRGEYTEISDKVMGLIDHQYFYGADHIKSSLFTITDNMLNKEFLALNHALKNPEALHHFMGKSLAIGYGLQNGFDYTFVVDHFKKWLNGEEVHLTYLQVCGGTIPTEEVKIWLEENAEQIFHGDGRDPPAEYIYRFKRVLDGKESEILVCKHNFGWISDADDAKRGFFSQFLTMGDPSPTFGSLDRKTRIK